LPGAHAGEFSRQARPGRRGGKRVANRAAIQNPEGLPGRSPGRFGRPLGAATEPRRGEGTLLLGSMFLAIGRCIAAPIAGPIAAAIGEPYEASPQEVKPAGATLLPASPLGARRSVEECFKRKIFGHLFGMTNRLQRISVSFISTTLISGSELFPSDRDTFFVEQLNYPFINPALHDLALSSSSTHPADIHRPGNGKSDPDMGDHRGVHRA